MPREVYIYIPGKGLMRAELVSEAGSVSVSADSNSRPLATGEFTGADELTDLGLTYGELDEILKSGSKPSPSA